MTNDNADNIENIYFSNTAIDVCLRIVEETSISPQEQKKLENILSQDNEVRVSQLANMIQRYFPKLENTGVIAKEVLRNYELASKKISSEDKRVSRSSVFSLLGSIAKQR